MQAIYCTRTAPNRGPPPMTAELFSAVLSAAMLVTTVVLVGAHRLQEVLGERAIVALERLMGLVLTALAVEMLLAGVRTFFASLAR